MSVKVRLILLISILLISLGIIGSMGVYSSKSWSSDLHKIDQDRLPGILYLANLNRERMVIRSQTLNVYAFENNYEASSDFSDIAKQRGESWKIIEDNWEKFVALPRASEKGRQSVEKLAKEYKAWREVYVTLDSIIAKLINNKDPQTQNELFKEYRKTVALMKPLSNSMGSSMDSLTKTNLTNTSKMIEDSTSLADTFVSIAIILFLAAIATGVIMAFSIISSIVSSLHKETTA